MSIAIPKKLIFLSLFLLTGCLSMNQKEKEENVLAIPSLDQSVRRGVESGIFTSGDSLQERWWELFDRPDLSEWMNIALADNPSLKAVQKRLEMAKQESVITKSKLYPYLFFDADDNWRYLSKNGFTHLLNPDLGLSGYQVDLSLSFQYEFDFWSKYKNLFLSSLGEVKTRLAELKQAELILSSSLAQSYFALVIQKEKRTLVQELCLVRQNRLSLQNRLLEGALSSLLPPLLDEQELRETQQLLLSIEEEIVIQTHLINALMGRGPDETLLFSEETQQGPPQSFPLPQTLSLDLLSRRPDLIAGIWRVESLAYQVSAAKADFFPNVNLAAFAGIESTLFQTLFQNHSKTGGVLPALSLPIFTAGAIRANLRAKKAEFDHAVFEYNNLLLKSAQEVTDLLFRTEIVYRQKSYQDQITEEAVQRLILTELRIEGGLDSQFSYLSFREEVLDKKLKGLDLLYGQYAFLIKLIQSLGGGYRSSPPFGEGT